MEGNRVFVLTGSYGSGHKTAAQGILDALRERGVEHASLDIVQEGGVIEKVSSFAFEVLMKRGHFAWRLFYYNPLPSSGPLRRLYTFVFKDRFMEPLRSFKPNIVISTHFVTSLIGLVYKSKNPHVKVFTVVTDLVAHPLWVWNGTDGYFVALEDTSQDLVNYGVNPEVINVSGIPLRKGFWNPMPKHEARKSLGYPLNRRVVLLSAGTYGSTPLGEILRVLSDEDVFVVVLAGRDPQVKALYEKEMDELGLEGVVYPFIQFVPTVMAASDLFITKAGGVSVAEALALGLPMIFVHSMPGQEEGNARLVEKYGAGLNAGSPKEASAVLRELLKQPHRLEEMSLKAKAMGKPKASLCVISEILQDHE